MITDHVCGQGGVHWALPTSEHAWDGPTKAQGTIHDQRAIPYPHDHHTHTNPIAFISGRSYVIHLEKTISIAV